MKAIIVGAGLAGLTAGFKLKQAGWDVTVLEAGSYAGGRSASVEDSGYHVDTGATQLSSGYEEYLGLCREVGLGNELMKCSQIVGFARDGRIIEINAESPTSGLLSPVASLGSKLTVARSMLDKLRMKPRLRYLDISDCHEHDDESFRDYADRRLSPEARDYLATPILRGNFLRDPDRATKLEWFSITDNFAGQTMITIRGGIRKLPTTLASRLDTRLNAPVTHVEQVGDKVKAKWLEGGMEQSDIADACVIATRLPESMKLCPAYAQIAAPLGAKLRYSRAVLAHIGFRKATDSKVIGVFVPKPEQPQIALIWAEHNKNPECAPPGHSLITCYFDDASPDNCYNMPDAQVADIARSYLEKLFPDLQGQCDFTRISRWPLAIPFPEPGVYREIHKLKQRLSPRDRIQHAGDYFTCTGQNSAIHYGKRAAQNLIDHCTN